MKNFCKSSSLEFNHIHLDIYSLEFLIRCSQHTKRNFFVCVMSKSYIHIFQFYSIIDAISLSFTYLLETSQEFIPMDLHTQMTTQFQSCGKVSVLTDSIVNSNIFSMMSLSCYYYYIFPVLFQCNIFLFSVFLMRSYFVHAI